MRIPVTPLKPDPLFEAAMRWGLDLESIKAAAAEPLKSTRTKAKRREQSKEN